MQLPKSVHVIEVGPRDGFQAEHEWIPTSEKIRVIDALSKTGLTEIQTTSFVHPKAVPQLADATEVMDKIERVPGVHYQVLVPNLKGLERAIAARPNSIHLMLSVTDSHNRANANRSVDETLDGFEQLVPVALEAGIIVEGGMGCTFGCPYEGEVAIEQVEKVTRRYVEMGVTGLALADTVGVANPSQVYRVAAHMLDRFPDVRWILHLHNTRDLALANVLAAMQAGMTNFDASVGGLGGCPYAPAATGNVASEDLVNMLTEMGISTGIDLDALIRVAKSCQPLVPHKLESSMVRAGRRTELQPAPASQQKIG